MPVVYMRTKPAMILLSILSVICLVDGTNKMDLKETLVGLVCLIYAVVTLINVRKRKLEAKKQAAQGPPPPVIRS